jgi:hypothetical protein
VSASRSASCTARLGVDFSRQAAHRREEAPLAAGSSRSAALGSSSTSPRRTPSPSASTSRASSLHDVAAGDGRKKSSTDAAILREFYDVEKVGRKKSDPEAKFAKAPGGRTPSATSSDAARRRPVRAQRRRNHRGSSREPSRPAKSSDIEVLRDPEDFLILNTLREDTTNSHEEALLKIYQRLRPGNPPQIEKAKRAVPREVLRRRTATASAAWADSGINRKFGAATSGDAA